MPDPPRTRRLLSRHLLTAPLSPQALEDRARKRMRMVFGWMAALLPALFLAALASAIGDAWSKRPVVLEPRHRPEALCFMLAQRPTFAPPMRVEPSAAVVRREFARDIAPALALQQVMQFSDAMVLAASERRAGDFDVANLWLRITDRGTPEYWLIVCWMNGGDLEVCNFRFAGDGPTLSDSQREWGERLLARLLVERNFRRGAMPKAHLRVRDGRTMPAFGPEA